MMSAHYCTTRMQIMFAILLLGFQVQGGASSGVSKGWEEWKVKYSKSYGNQIEEALRRAVWEQNRRLVVQHNLEASAGKHSFTLELNHLADMAAEEINEKMNNLKEEEWAPVRNGTFEDKLDLKPPSVDWRKEGLVSPVRNQGACGSCWAFSALGALEGQMKKKTGILVPLSPQNLVDCSTEYGNHGCKGGYMTNSYKYIIDNGGVDSERFYPYEHKEGKCRYSVRGKAGWCSGFEKLPHGDEKTLKAVVASVGPVSVTMNANLTSFHFYGGGLYNVPNCNPDYRNHAVLVVGYGTFKSQDFWLVKNSWGTEWGEDGYIRIARNAMNLCGIASSPVYPIL